MITGRLNYLNEGIRYYVGNIFEYDIKHAYPSILKNTDFKFTDKTLRKDIEELDNYKNKKELLIRIGYEIKYNRDIIKYINDKLLETIELFQSHNSLDDNNVISIKKDALFVTKMCKNLVFNDIEFVEKHNFQLYFYDFVKKHEYYINKKFNNYYYNIKGINNNDIDDVLYTNISKLIYYSIINNDLKSVQNIQTLFMNEDIKSIDYCPSEILYKDLLYIDKESIRERLLNNKEVSINLKEIYFDSYHSVCKSLINYLI